MRVLARKTKADETIEAASEDPFVFVLNNDRFTEYRGKPAARDNRLLRHDMINGPILVHDLNLSVPFAAKDD